jgi:DNA-directed RNA polymerase specialized sigma24 family protein
VRIPLNVHVSRWRRNRREVAWNDVDVVDGADVTSVVDGDRAAFAALRALPVRQREVVAAPRADSG